MRFAGTCSRYSNSAMLQLRSAANSHGLADISFRCAYQANVMKTFEAHSSPTVFHNTGLANTRAFQPPDRRSGQIGSASWRERVCQCVKYSVGSEQFKKKK